MRWTNVLVIFATFFAYISPFVNPINFWQFSFFGLIYPWLLLANLLFVGLWIFRKKKYFLFSLGCILIGWGHVISFVGLNFGGETTVENSITVASYNIYNFKKIYKRSDSNEVKRKKENEFVNFLQQGGVPQILCTQETSIADSKFIQERFNLPYVHNISYKWTFIFSKFPIVNSGYVDIETRHNSCVWADLKINNQIIRVYSIHLQSNRISSTADKVLAEGDLRSKETLKDIKGMMGKFRFFTKLRAKQAKLVADHIANSPHSVIICGDFNDTPQSFTYQILTKNLKDTFKEKGKGFGTTYAGSIPALRIDYILVDNKIKVHSHKILKENFSDHYPVICKISL